MLVRRERMHEKGCPTMPITSSQALVAALVLAAAPAFAQEASPPAPKPARDAQPAQQTPPAADQPSADAASAEPAPAATPDGGAGAASGEAPAAPSEAAPGAPADTAATTTAPASAPAPAPADAAPQVGQYYVKETNGDWTTRCLKADGGKDPCELYQLLKDGENNSVAELTVIPLTNGEVAAGATLIAPLETDLIQGLGFAIGTAKPNGYPFSFCAPIGCVSRLGFTEAEVSALKRGSTGTLSLLPFGGDPKNPVRLSVSLTGFTAGFDALAAYAAEPAPAAEAPAADAPPN